MTVYGGREDGCPHVFWVKYKLYNSDPVDSDRNFQKEYYDYLMPFFWSAMEIPLPANMVSVEDFLGLGMWDLGKALDPTAKDVKPEPLVLVPADLLGFISHQRPWSTPDHSCFKDLLPSTWKADSFPFGPGDLFILQSPYIHFPSLHG